jgi:DNA-binding NarL/FixJ family response regulator
VRVVIADDSGLFRRGLRLLLEAADVDVVDDVGTVPELLRALERQRPDVCMLEVRLPPSCSDDGIRVAQEIRRLWPGVGLLILSARVDTGWAEQLLSLEHGAVGYLLKDRVDQVANLVAALRRVASGGTAFDPDILESLVRRRSVGRLDSLTPREREVLGLMAQGFSNTGIGRRLFVSGKTVETYVAAIFSKMRLDDRDAHRDRNRRVLAVLTYLQHSP